MPSFTQKLFEVFGFEILLWHAIVAVAAVLLLIVIIIAAAVSKRKKAKKLAEFQRLPQPETAQASTSTVVAKPQEEPRAVVYEQPAKQTRQTEQTKNVEEKQTEKEQKQMPKKVESKTEAKKPEAKTAAKKTEIITEAKTDPKAKTTVKKEEKPVNPAKKATETKPKSQPAKKSESADKAIATPKADKKVGQLPDDVETVDNEEQEKIIEQKQRNGARYYHVSLNENDKWQVKLSKGAKAIKTFDKQSEAIDYARGLARSNHGHIVIHRVNGKIRKTRY